VNESGMGARHNKQYLLGKVKQQL